jgi:hypothetical protein
METSSLALPHAPPGTVHLKTLMPVARLLTEVFAKAELANVPEPETTDQEPPEAAVALSVVELAHMVWSVPACGGFPGKETFIVT